MGTVGGKIGFAVGIVSAIALIEPMIALIVGRCVFNGGCGKFDTAGLVGAGLATLIVVALVGVAVRTLVNRLINLARANDG
jgi:hypothetical protein